MKIYSFLQFFSLTFAMTSWASGIKYTVLKNEPGRQLLIISNDTHTLSEKIESLLSGFNYRCHILPLAPVLDSASQPPYNFDEAGINEILQADSKHRFIMVLLYIDDEDENALDAIFCRLHVYLPIIH
ncbi:MAG: hypothetical protein KC505_10240 [Myxococcales bacterium]|nr:hypothetical protein [Myxococcales bacterium]USN51107.1 MAG: hypothetical protein H6731_01475 [Myxococcales bacterium]